jgi:hypothetical protein
MKKISIYLRATRVLAPIFVVIGGLGFLMSVLALMGAPMETATGKPMSAILAWKYINSSIETLIIGIVLGAISAIGYSLFDRSNSE